MSANKRLTEKECYEMFRAYNTPDHVIAHCRAVSDTAVAIGRQLNDHGFDLDLDLIKMAGLIHDVARTNEHHEIIAADMLEKAGFTEEAAIVRVHMRYDFNSLDKINETDIMCLGDRVVKEDRYVGIDERVDYLIHKKGENPQRTESLLTKKQETKAFISHIEERIGMSIDSIFAPSLDQLLKQVEKPGRYIGNEINISVKETEKFDVRFAFAFPDLYEIGMSYVGLQILYNIVNKKENLYCERVFAPAADMEALMRDYSYPLFTLETKTPVKNMDVLGFTLQYEMSFTNILNMLELAGIPLLSKDRDDSWPLIIAGGPCAFNPEPLADFIDIFIVGDGEQALPELLETVADAKKSGKSKTELFKIISDRDGIYIPSFYDVYYNEDGTIQQYKKNWDGAPDRIRKSIIEDIEYAEFPMSTIVPLIDTVHDRAVVETFRGCTRGCRFCQAGMIYRPVRERKSDSILKIAEEQLKNSGHDELSILSLSTSDYSDFEDLTLKLTKFCKDKDVSLSLPSLRLDSFSFKVLEEIQKYKKSGLTFAPEAGTQRLRDIINKGITDKDIYDAVEQAIELGWRHVKLYFMIGLPGETYEDLDGIAEIARNIIGLHKKSGKGGRFNVTISISNFVPKAHTPFQWEPQDSTEEFRKKHEYLTERLKIKNVTYNYHDDEVSTCEAVIARGDRRCSDMLIKAHEAGCKFDGWSEYFNREAWKNVLEEGNGVFYSQRKRSYDEVLPWDIIDSGVTKSFLKSENDKAGLGDVTADCRQGCVGCGINSRVRCAQGGSDV
ncbi:TIGR03960 family B12-binding radical SAM protein [Aminicella lysinilytica]|uniref:TIGR03960 family B12-binding radical SAM protein n=1 Tax=Aminicella lysinilytica TaxID=433323 RepID=UPI002ED075E3